MLRSLGIAFLITAATAAAAAAAPEPATVEKATDAQDKMICKKFLETGSLVRGYRICKTKAEWTRDRDLAKTQTAGESCRSLGQGGSCG